MRSSRNWPFRRRLALAVFLLPGCHGGADDPKAACKSAEDEARYADAVTTCAAAMDADPDPMWALRHARALHQVGDLPGARAAAQALVSTPLAGAAWRLLGRVSEREGQAEAARTAFEQARAAHVAAGEIREAAYDAHALAGSHWRQSRNAEALAALLDARALADQAGDERLGGIVLQGVGSLLVQVGADAVAAEALAEADKRLQKFALDRAPVAHARGILARDNLEVPRAEMYFEEAIQLAQAAGSVRVERTATANLAFCAVLRGDAAAARTALDRAFSLADRDPDKGERAFLYLVRAQERRLSGSLDEARAALDTADASEPLPDLVWCVAYERGLVELARGDTGRAEDALLRAVGHIQHMRQSMGLDALKRGFFSNRRAPFEALFALRQRQGRERDAAALAESVLGRSFLDAFARTGVAGVSKAAKVPDAPDANLAAAGADAVHAAEARWRQVVARDTDWQRLAPDLTASAIVHSQGPAALLAALGGRRVLVYFEAEGAAYWIVYGGASVHVRKLAAPSEAVRAAAEAFTLHLDDAPAAAALSRALALGDVLPPAGEAVYVVPDGPLMGVPLAALPSGESQPPLIATHTLVLAPSVTALAALLSESARVGPDNPGHAPLVLGDPGGDLPAARAEAVELAARLGIKPLLGADARFSALLQAKDAPLIHIAAHAGLDASGPWLSLADTRAGVGDIVRAGLHPRLVVLASCASGATLEEELWGSLAAAFLAGGAANVLATLRSVDDTQARRLVTAFYQDNLYDGPAAALAQVQRSLLATEPPSRWANFVVVGQGDVSPKARAPQFGKIPGR